MQVRPLVLTSNPFPTVLVLSIRQKANPLVHDLIEPYLVRDKGLEPLRLTTAGLKPDVSANSTNPAYLCLCLFKSTFLLYQNNVSLQESN